jgi:hypothetical protein
MRAAGRAYRTFSVVIHTMIVIYSCILLVHFEIDAT